MPDPPGTEWFKQQTQQMRAPPPEVSGDQEPEITSDSTAAQSMTHGTPPAEPSPPIYHPPSQQIPGVILQHLLDLAMQGPRITQDVMEEGYHGQPMDEETMARRGMMLAGTAIPGRMPSPAELNVIAAIINKLTSSGPRMFWKGAAPPPADER